MADSSVRCALTHKALMSGWLYHNFQERMGSGLWAALCLLLTVRCRSIWRKSQSWADSLLACLVAPPSLIVVMRPGRRKLELHPNILPVAPRLLRVMCESRSNIQHVT